MQNTGQNIIITPNPKKFIKEKILNNNTTTKFSSSQIENLQKRILDSRKINGK